MDCWESLRPLPVSQKRSAYAIKLSRHQRVTNSSGKPQHDARGRRSGAGLTRSAKQRSEFEELVGPARTTSPPSRVRAPFTVLTEDRPLKRDRDQTLFFPDHLYVAHDNLRKREGGILATLAAVVTLRCVPQTPQEP
jgi:hypothetical protein